LINIYEKFLHILLLTNLNNKNLLFAEKGF